MLEPDRRAPGRSPCSFVGLNDAHAAARPDYFERRKRKHRAGFEDASRWRKHLAPYFEHLRPARVDAARIRAFIEAKLAQEANPATVRIYIALLSALFADLRERGIAQLNPSRGLPRSTMRLMRSTHDPRTTPFIEKLTDVRRIYLALPESRSVETEDERRGLVIPPLRCDSENGRSRPVSREPQEVNAPDTATRSSAVSTGGSALGSIAAAARAESLSGATWAQNWIQRREPLPAPTPDLFAQAGAIVARRAARGGASDADLAAIIARSSAQAARLVVEGAPSASAEQRV